MAHPPCWKYVIAAALVAALTHSQNNNTPTQFYYQLLEEQSPGYYISNIKNDARLAEQYDVQTLATLRFQFLIHPSILVSLDSETGALTTRGRIDRDTICPRQSVCNITLEIAVQPVQYFQIFKAVLTIIDMNDITPTFIQAATSKSIQESADIGDTILLPTANDDDSPAFGVTRYELHGPDTWAFQLDSSTRLDGVNEVRLILGVELDREGKDRYNVKVWAHDGGDPPNSGYMDVTVNVQDSNDNPPVFENSTYYISLLENYQLGATFLRVRAHDPDIGLNGALTYDLAYYSKALYGDIFSVDRRTGALSLEIGLDHETTQKYTLSVIARDKGPDPIETEAIVIITVLDVNDIHPRIYVNTLTETDTDQAAIAENLAATTFVAHVSVKDEDQNESGVVACTLTDPYFELVSLYEKEYKVVTKRVLDRENKSLHDIAILCKDNGTPRLQSIKHVEIDVLDENDNSPSFVSGIINTTIYENNLIGANIIHILASDKDSGLNGQLEFAIPSSVLDRISINATSGMITALRSFDREYESKLIFNVIAKDHGNIMRSSSATVIINILDENDERPLFSESISSLSIIENSAVGSLVGIVQAFDGDAYPYNMCEYSLLPSNDSWMFSINPVNGMIRIEAPVDRELRLTYYVTVAATDLHNSALFSHLELIINIEDVNDEIPTFVFPSSDNHTVYISPEVPKEYLVTKILAWDLDIGQNARLAYTIASGNKKGYFYLHESSGYLTVARSFHDIDYKVFELELKVEDEGEISLFSITSLEVVVDSAISYSASKSTNSSILSKTKLVVIVILAIVSAILIIILLIAILFLRRMEIRRKKHQKHKSRMEKLAKLTVNNNQKPPVRNHSKVKGGSQRSKGSDGTNLWKTPLESQLEGGTPLLFADDYPDFDLYGINPDILQRTEVAKPFLKIRSERISN